LQFILSRQEAIILYWRHRDNPHTTMNYFCNYVQISRAVPLSVIDCAPSVGQIS